MDAVAEEVVFGSVSISLLAHLFGNPRDLSDHSSMITIFRPLLRTESKFRKRRKIASMQPLEKASIRSIFSARLPEIMCPASYGQTKKQIVRAIGEQRETDANTSTGAK